MAKSKKEPGKILRIGIIQNETVLEERLIRKRETVTIGSSPKSTFIVPVPALQKPVPLLQLYKGSYWVAYRSGMRGRLSVGGQVLKLADAARSPKAEKRGDTILVPIDEESRGKIRLQDLTLLFQFVFPPPTMPKPQLPASAKGSIWKQMDYTLLAILMVSFLIQGGGIGGIEFWWANYGQYEADTFRSRRKKRVFESLISEIKTKEEQEKEEEEEKEKEEEEEAPSEVVEAPTPKRVVKKKVKKEEPKPDYKPQNAEEKAKALEARRQKIKAKLRKNTLLKFVGSAGGDGGMGPDTLSEGVNSAKLANAWDATGGVQVAAAGEKGTYVGGPKAAAGAGGSYAGLSKKDLGGGNLKAKRVKTGGKRKEKKLNLRIGGNLGKGAGMGKIDRSSVASIFRRRMSAIKFCYQKALKKNPSVQGKVAVKFQIGPAGRITKIKVVKNSTGDSSLGSCIIKKVKGWRFPKPERGSVTFVYPFILKKG